jgi:hypothetical protein
LELNFMNFLKSITITVVLAAPVLASANTLVDGSFEIKGAALPVSAYCYDASATPGGPACAAGAWVGDSGVILSGNGAWGGTAAADGDYYGFVQGLSVLSQTFNATATTLQTLTWADANRSGYGGLQTYEVSISGGAGTASLGTFTSATGAFIGRQSSTFLLSAGNAYTLRFTGLVNADSTVFIDSVALQAVPEPATWALFLVALGAAGVARRGRHGAGAV